MASHKTAEVLVRIAALLEQGGTSIHSNRVEKS
jgi:hypothetical protein